MNTGHFTVMPFILAMLIAVARMPTNVYQICRKQVGTLEIEPWRQAASSLNDAVRASLSWFASLKFRWAVPVAAAVVFALLMADLQAAGSGVVLATIVAGSTDLNEIRNEINKLGTDMSAMVAKAGEEKREMTADEETRFDAMDADREKLLKTERRLRVVSDLDASQGRRSAPVQPGTENRGIAPGGERRTVNLAEGVRAWLLSSKDQQLSAEQVETARRCGINLGAKHLTLRLPSASLRSLRHDQIQEWEKRALSADSSSSPVDGHYTVANELMRPLEEALLAFGGMRRFSSVIRTGTGADLPIPTDNDTANEGEIIGENSLVNEQDTAFGQLVLEAYKYSSKMIKVSVEFLQDSSINVGGYIGGKLGERIGRITNRHFTVGDGSSKPRGLLAATTASGVQLAAKTPTYAEMVQIQHSVDPAYRAMPSAGWMFHDSMLSEVKQIVDASTGRPIWVPTMAGGEPDLILGDPFVVNQHMAVAAASGAAKSIAYGDLSKYQIRDVREITLVRLDERIAEYHQVAFLAFSRHDGDLLDAGTHPVKHALNKS